MKSKRVFSTIAGLCLSILITGCSSSPYNDYQALVERKPGKIFENINEIVKTVPAKELSTTKEQLAKIRITDPVMRLGKVVSNFKLFKSVELDIATYQVDIVSDCYECVGFRKKTVLPYLELYDSNQNVVKTIDTLNLLGTGHSINKSFNVLQPGYYYFLVAADNRSLDDSQITTSKISTSTGSFSVPISVQNSPEGDVKIKLSKIE
ncbi:hypothetical protein RYZ26_01515 [Terasakiella sp. A23]|uniref:hypothetical protein n=1 Tax=Terasakiella sp. FCG-A23 TaxID=3080561 RepID=UPI0029551038|nr:hypothetical protein [Terasakiella sp. A23]MDV7338254.1 hypothetical protein [Terasakiella sp. A23]